MDKIVDTSNNKENFDKHKSQETYKRIFTINKNELKTAPSNKNENDDINNDQQNSQDNIPKKFCNDINNDDSNSEFDKNIIKYSSQIAEDNLILK